MQKRNLLTNETKVVTSYARQSKKMIWREVFFKKKFLIAKCTARERENTAEVSILMSALVCFRKQF